MTESGRRNVLGPEAFAPCLHQCEAKHLLLVVQALQYRTSGHWVEFSGKQLLRGKSMSMLKAVLSIASLCDYP